jgi:hypothetical protein
MNLDDILGGVKSDIGKAASSVLGVTNPSPVAKKFTNNLDTGIKDVGDYFGGTPGKGIHFGDPLGGLVGGGPYVNTPGGGGGSSAPTPTTNYWNQAFGPSGPYSTMNGIDSNKLMQYFQQTIPGFNPNDQKQVTQVLGTALQQGWIQPAFLGGSGGSDPLTQQALFQNTIKPYLQNISNSEAAGNASENKIISGIQNQYGASESPNVKALLGTLDQSIQSQGAQDVNYADSAALSTPGITDILDALRAQYINQLNDLTTGTGTTTPAKIPAPSTLTAVNNALAG